MNEACSVSIAARASLGGLIHRLWYTINGYVAGIHGKNGSDNFCLLQDDVLARVQSAAFA